MSTSLSKGTVRVQVRKDTASNWTSADPILAVGEFGFETDTNKLKIGDGSTAWTGLGYIGVSSEGITDGHVLTADGSDGAAWEAAAGGGGSRIDTLSKLHRWGASADNQAYGGYSSGYSKNTKLWGLTSEGDTSIYHWVAMNYSDYMVPAAGEITSFKTKAYQNYASSDISLKLFRIRQTGTETDHSTDAATCAFIGKIDYTANADTTTVHWDLETCGSLDGSAKVLAEGDLLMLTVWRESGTDANYWYIRHMIEITYD